MIIHSDFQELEKGIKELAITYGEKIFDDISRIDVSCGEKTFYKKSAEGISIQAPTLSMAYTALGRALSQKTQNIQPLEVKKHFERLGVMLDCARNAAANLEPLKKFISAASLMGYSYVELYLEDCFEVDNEPFFGYMRGRYRKEELKELDVYAQMFGIELIPAIQTLAHLPRIFVHWQEYAEKILDTGAILLVGEERTYALIENMIKTCRECFSSKNINLGMDEAGGLGQGKYKQLHGTVPPSVIIRQHLEKVTQICQKYDFSPAIWADMFYEDIQEGKVGEIPKDLQLIFWHYGNIFDYNFDNGEDEEYYSSMFDALQNTGLKYSFAGSGQNWHGFTPQNHYAIMVLKLQAAAARKGGVSDFKITLWGNDWGECSYFSVFSTLVAIAEDNIDGNKDDFADAISNRLTGYHYAELLDLDLPNKLYDEPVKRICNPSKYLLYLDSFIGQEELVSKPDYGVRYAEIAKKLKKYAQRRNSFSYMFETQFRLAQVLELKATLTEDIDRAYRENNKKELEEICNYRLPLIQKRVKAFIKAFRKQWLYENRPIGLEVQEYRLYGLLGRLASVKERISMYLAGEISNIAELEETKIHIFESDSTRFNGCRYYNSMAQNVTYGYYSM